MNQVKPSPSGQLFAECAAAIRPMESCALLLGRLIDECRSITLLPLTAEGRELAVAALRMLSAFDRVRVDLEYRLGEIERLGRHLSNLTRLDGGTHDGR
jgi:hypothetical protein